MDIEIEVDLERDELAPDVRIDVLARLTERMIAICNETPRNATIDLLAAAIVTLIRNSPPAMSVALDLKELMPEAMVIARRLTKPPPRTEE